MVPMCSSFKKWSLLARAKSIAAHRMILTIPYNNHTELITALFDGTQVSRPFEPCKFRVVGSITTGNGANVFELHFDPKKPISLEQLRASMTNRDKPSLDEPIFLNLLAEEVDPAHAEVPETDESPVPLKKKLVSRKKPIKGKGKEGKKVKIEVDDEELPEIVPLNAKASSVKMEDFDFDDAYILGFQMK